MPPLPPGAFMACSGTALPSPTDTTPNSTKESPFSETDSYTALQEIFLNPKTHMFVTGRHWTVTKVT
jgi:hypothetical protein